MSWSNATSSFKEARVSRAVAVVDGSPELNINTAKIEELLGQYATLKQDAENEAKKTTPVPGSVALSFATTPYERLANYPDDKASAFETARSFAAEVRAASNKLAQLRDDYKLMAENWQVFGASSPAEYDAFRDECQRRIMLNEQLLSKLRPSRLPNSEKIATQNGIPPAPTSLRSIFPISSPQATATWNGFLAGPCRGIFGGASIDQTGVITPSFTIWSDHITDACTGGATAILKDVNGQEIGRYDLGQATTPGKGTQPKTARFVATPVPTGLSVTQLIRVRSIEIVLRGP